MCVFGSGLSELYLFFFFSKLMCAISLLFSERVPFLGVCNARCVFHESEMGHSNRDRVFRRERASQVEVYTYSEPI